MSDVKDWNKYFNEVFNGAWDCYSNAEDEPYKQWVKIGARWAIDFQNDLISDLNFETETKNAYKNKVTQLQQKLDAVYAKAMDGLGDISHNDNVDGDIANATMQDLKKIMKDDSLNYREKE